MLNSIVSNGDAVRIMHMSCPRETLRWFLISAMKAQQEMGHYVCICTSEESDECMERNELSDAECLCKEGLMSSLTILKRSIWSRCMTDCDEFLVFAHVTQNKFSRFLGGQLA